MMSTNLYQPFFSPQQLEEPAFCDQCGEAFEEGEQALELTDGVIGRGRKSGRLMVVESQIQKGDINTVTLHRQCATEFIYHWILNEEMPEEEEQPEPEMLCAACESKLES